jgi:hypothetical protein
MKKLVSALVVALVLGGAATFGVVRYLQLQEEQRELLAKTLAMQEELSTIKKDLLGYTKFLDYMTVTKKAMSGQMKFLGAKVDREYVQIENIQKSTMGLKSDATILVKYSVEYSFGYDLRPQSFSITGDKNSISVTVGKPEMIASPAVNIASFEIPNSSLFIDSKTAVIKLQQRLLPVALKQANDIKSEEAVQALCEKKLTELLRDFLSKQPGVGSVPVITIAYR